jgi:hypothetical protein
MFGLKKKVGKNQKTKKKKEEDLEEGCPFC